MGIITCFKQRSTTHISNVSKPCALPSAIVSTEANQRGCLRQFQMNMLKDNSAAIPDKYDQANPTTTQRNETDYPPCPKVGQKEHNATISKKFASSVDSEIHPRSKGATQTSNIENREIPYTLEGSMYNIQTRRGQDMVTIR